MPTSNNNTRRKSQPTIVVGANDLGKLPPQAPELEQAILGALMLDCDAFTIVSDILTDKSFYDTKHEKIYDAIRSLSVAEKPIDYMTVGEQLKENGCLEQAGGLEYLIELTSKVASTAHLRYHAEIVSKKAIARDLIRLTATLTEQAFDESNDVDELIQNASAGVFEISQRQQKKDVRQIDPVISEALKRIEIAGKNEGNISGIPSGFDDLDKLTGGWQKSDLVIIAARPAMGKTAFVLSMAKNMAVDYHTPVAVFSLEMSDVQLVNRLIMNVCEVPGNKIKSGKLNAADWRQVNANIRQLQGAPLYIDDTPQLSVFELRAKARKLKQQHNIQMIIIDYLQLMNANGMQFGSREQEVSIISRNLKGLAKELDIPIIALSQLNRGVEARTGAEGKKPQLSDLRESGAIEQDADMVCFIHRPEYYHIYNDEATGKDLRGVGQIIVAKHRNGATDEVNLKFVGSLAKFMNLTDQTPTGLDDPLPEAPAATYGSRMNSMSMPDTPDSARLDTAEAMPF